MEKNDGGPAFPVDTSTARQAGHTFGGVGMTLRDWFAGQALGGFLANPDVKNDTGAIIAEAAYMLADAMLAARGGSDGR